MEKPSIAIIGTGYVGLVSAVTFARHGFKVTCVDVLPEKVEAITQGKAAFYEPGLDDELKELVPQGLISATTDTRQAVLENELVFICVGTPSREDGSIDLKYVEGAAGDVGKVLKDKDGYTTVVMKSTVVPGSTRDTVLPILERESGKKAGGGFGLCMNPEFLREGSALHDSFNPERIVIGGFDDRSRLALMPLYDTYSCPKMQVDLATAEMIKYASNTFLALKITYANEMANLCERVNVDVYQVMEGIALDDRICPAFLRAGAGFGGSCFPKDVKALVARAGELGYDTGIFKAMLELNERQPLRLVELARQVLGALVGKRVAVLGLAFKPGTDDIRETRALPLVKALLDEKAQVVGWDPKAAENFREIAPPIEYVDNISEALAGADCCIIHTEWDEVKALKPEDFDGMKQAVVIDGRRALDPEAMLKAGVAYRGIGWRNL